MLLWAMFGDPPYPFFGVMRWSIAGVTLAAAIVTFLASQRFLPVCLLLLAIGGIHAFGKMEREDWPIYNFVAFALLAIVAIFMAWTKKSAHPKTERIRRITIGAVLVIGTTAVGVGLYDRAHPGSVSGFMDQFKMQTSTEWRTPKQTSGEPPTKESTATDVKNEDSKTEATTTNSKGKIVLGKLGQALEATPIKASPDTNSRTYYKVAEYEYLVIQASKYEEWLKVLLENGTYGYVHSKSVAKLPYEVTADAATTPANAKLGARMASMALSYGEKPYVRGGRDLNKGIGGPEFVKAISELCQKRLPNNPTEQAKVGTPIRRLEELLPGDRLYFWDKSAGRIEHAGIYLGQGYFAHASPKAGKVKADFLGDKEWTKALVAARR